MSKIEKNNRRKHLRLKVYHLAKYRPLAGQEGQGVPIVAAIENLGAGGICLRTPEALPVSGMLELKISCPSLPQAFSALARVVWVKPRSIGKSKHFLVGAEFVRIDEDMRRFIDEQARYVDKKIKPKKKTGLSIFGWPGH